jgi:hypothetical protein
MGKSQFSNQIENVQVAVPDARVPVQNGRKFLEPKWHEAILAVLTYFFLQVKLIHSETDSECSHYVACL